MRAQILQGLVLVFTRAAFMFFLVLLSAYNVRAKQPGYRCEVLSYSDQINHVEKFDVDFGMICGDDGPHIVPVPGLYEGDKFEIELSCDLSLRPLYRYHLAFMQVSPDGHSAFTVVDSVFQENGLSVYFMTPSKSTFSVNCLLK